jgi:hypothetical protein
MLMKRSIAVITSLLTLSLLAACAGQSHLRKPDRSEYPTKERRVAGCSAGENSFDCDRRAILAMQGGYEVQFKFDETVVLKSGYERKEPKRSGGFETVVLVEDAGKRISLQHILVMGGGVVVKHWRQDWVYESPRHWVYAGNQRFEQREPDAKQIPGAWTQLVYEVNDGPRYSGTAKWNHKYGVSTWTSERNWRPLPRREYTSRTDYQLINAENRHTITPQGWTHEQDNTKVMRSKEGKDTTLVREFGFNDYRRIEGYDFGPALAYWNSTSNFWADVRTRWEKEFTADEPVTLLFKTGDESFNNTILDLAEAYRENPVPHSYRKKIDDAFSKFVKR